MNKLSTTKKKEILEYMELQEIDILCISEVDIYQKNAEFCQNSVKNKYTMRIATDNFKKGSGSG